MVSGGMRHQGAASSLDGASLLRIWEAGKVLRKCTSTVVGHNSKNKLCIHLRSCDNQLRPPPPPPPFKSNQII